MFRRKERRLHEKSVVNGKERSRLPQKGARSFEHERLGDDEGVGLQPCRDETGAVCTPEMPLNMYLPIVEILFEAVKTLPVSRTVCGGFPAWN